MTSINQSLEAIWRITSIVYGHRLALSRLVSHSHKFGCCRYVVAAESAPNPARKIHMTQVRLATPLLSMRWFSRSICVVAAAVLVSCIFSPLLFLAGSM
jgi:hypothetical protein